MKRYRHENPASTAWKRSWLQFQEAWWLWPYRPQKKAGARRKRWKQQLQAAYDARPLILLPIRPPERSNA